MNPIAQVLVTAAIPTFAVLFGIFLNRQDITTLRTEIIQLRDNIHRDMISLHERVATMEAKQQR